MQQSEQCSCISRDRRVMLDESRALLSHDPEEHGHRHEPIHVVTGAGPVGTTVARQLAEPGPARCGCLTRSGSGPEHPLDRAPPRRRLPARAARPRRSTGAVAVHHCIHGSAYAARTWRAELPAAEQAVLDAAGAGRRGGRLPREPLLLRPGRRPDHRGPAARRARPASSASAPSCCAPAGRVGDADRQRRGLRLLRTAGAHRPRRASGWCRPSWPARRCGWSAASTSRTRSPTCPTSRRR